MSTKKKQQELDMEKLLKALDNDTNQHIVESDLDYNKINAAKNTILQQLQLPRETLKTMHKQLKAYRYIETLEEIRYGSYIRWISLKNPAEIKLTNGGIVVQLKVVQSKELGEDEIHIVCRNAFNRLFQLKLNENIIFQKLNDQEQVLLSAMEYLNTF
jgi:hypothetical protein